MSKLKSKNSVFSFWKSLRVAILLIVLLVVALGAWRDGNQDWDKPIMILLHPINADGRPSTAQYIQSLQSANFTESQDYFKATIKQYTGKNASVYFTYGRELTDKPPVVPNSGKVLDAIIWSLKFRYYAWKQHKSSDGSPTTTLYLNFYDPQYQQSLRDSTALQKGRIGIVNLFADEPHHGSNQVVMVHELLHTFGATDKYDLSTGQPIYPIGFAEPEKQPRFPQAKAELMAAYIPLSETKGITPPNLSKTVINKLTAQEVGWLKK
ncbi:MULTISPECIES: hypothetical protein [unclassified Acinetobacter]|uniref:hypothetical protein n=1 Tax=unclassified Acinetobacter TaxID=196816 RepID=UPI0035BA7872